MDRVITVTTPCCEDGIDCDGNEHKVPQFRLAVIGWLPRQTYERKCPLCGSVWRIERTTLAQSDGICVDQTEWTPLRERLGNGTFRVNHKYD